MLQKSDIFVMTPWIKPLTFRSFVSVTIKSGEKNFNYLIQAELGKLLLETSRVLKEMSGKSSGEMDMDHHNKIEMMKKAWDAFDTEGRM